MDLTYAQSMRFIKLGLVGLIIIFCACVPIACGNDQKQAASETTTAESVSRHSSVVDSTFTLNLGESLILDQTGYRIGFSSIITDNRCAKGTDCLIPNLAIIEISVTDPDASSAHEHEIIIDAQSTITSIGKYDVKILGLTPSRDAVRTKDDYVVTLMVKQPTSRNVSDDTP